MTKTYSPGDKLLILDKTGGRFDGPVKYQEGTYRLYEATIGATQRKLLDYYREARLPPSYNRANAINRGCSEKNSFSVGGKIRVVQGSDIVLNKKSEIFESFLILPCADRRECDYSYRGRIKGCVPGSLMEVVVPNHLTESGFEKFILILGVIKAASRKPGD
jgi:hypothetical protein